MTTGAGVDLYHRRPGRLDPLSIEQCLLVTLDDAAYLDAAYDDVPPADLPVERRHADTWTAVLQMARRGDKRATDLQRRRLFDAVAALLGVRDTVNYEGQAGIELEQLADPAATGTYPVAIYSGRTVRVQTADLVRGVLDDLHTGVARDLVAGRFHNSIAAAIVRTCSLLAESSGLRTVARSGGVFQNILLLGRVTDGLTADGFQVLIHSRVPPNDGGISLGKAAVAATLDRAS